MRAWLASVLFLASGCAVAPDQMAFEKPLSPLAPIAKAQSAFCGDACVNVAHAVPTPALAVATPQPQLTARCDDGWYSYSEDRQGTCSGHRGVREWYRNP
jgi:Protein of unknown function (DUF3761)